MSSKVPCLHFFPSDHIADTLHLSVEAQGCYLLILLHTWNNKCKPYEDDDKVLRRLLRITPAKWKKIKKEISPFFDLSESSFRQKRLERTWAKALDRSQKSKEAAEKRHSMRRAYKERSLADALPKRY